MDVHHVSFRFFFGVILMLWIVVVLFMILNKFNVFNLLSLRVSVSCWIWYEPRLKQGFGFPYHPRYMIWTSLFIIFGISFARLISGILEHILHYSVWTPCLQWHRCYLARRDDSVLEEFNTFWLITFFNLVMGLTKSSFMWYLKK